MNESINVFGAQDADDQVRQPVRRLVPLLDGLARRADGPASRRRPAPLAAARPLPAAAAALGHRQEVHGRVRRISLHISPRLSPLLVLCLLSPFASHFS